MWMDTGALRKSRQATFVGQAQTAFLPLFAVGEHDNDPYLCDRLPSEDQAW